MKTILMMALCVALLCSAFAGYTQDTKPVVKLPVTDGLVLWMKADTGVEQTPDAKVTAWRDQSPLGNDLVCDQAELRPTVALNAVNTLPALTFAGKSSLVLAAGKQLAFSQAPHTVLVMAKRTSDKPDHDMVSTMRVGAPGSMLLMLYQQRVRGHVWFAKSASILDSENTVPKDVWSVFGQRLTKTDFDVLINGKRDAKSAVTDPTAATPFNSLIIGNRSQGTPSGLQGQLTEVIIFNRALTDAELAQITKYFATRYALTL